MRSQGYSWEGRTSTAEEVIEALSQAPEVGSMKTHTEYAQQAIRERDVELAIDALQIDDEWEREALRRFYARERPGFKVSVWPLFKFLCKIVAVSVAIWALLVVAMLASM